MPGFPTKEHHALENAGKGLSKDGEGREDGMQRCRYEQGTSNG
jgi:hypothetical protein